MSPDECLRDPERSWREFRETVALLHRVAPVRPVVRMHGEREPSKTEVLGDYFETLCRALLASGWTKDQLARYVSQQLAERERFERYRRARQERDR
jgi:hypothetical protein